MASVLVPLCIIVAQIIASSAIQSFYGIAIAAVCMLATCGINVAYRAYGPVVSTAGTIAEFCPSEMKERTKTNLDHLDAIGDTMSATAKGHSIAAAALTTVALIATFIRAAGLQDVAIDDSVVFAGIFLGAMHVFVVSAMILLSVNKTADEILLQVREQFDKQPRLKEPDWEGPEGVPDYKSAVATGTWSAMLETFTPLCLALFCPFVVGYLLGSRCLTGVLVGVVTSGMCLAFSLTTAGGAWESAKKLVTKKDEVMVATSLGDPFKDAAGPSLNVLSKLTALLSIVLAPSFQSINPSGTVFPNANFWIGIIILAVVAFVVLVFNYCMMGRYKTNGEKLNKMKTVNGDRAPAAAPAQPPPSAATSANSQDAPVQSI